MTRTERLAEKQELQRLSIEREIKRINNDLKRVSSIVGSEALAKSCCDPFDYALKLKTGEIIFFESAKVVSKDWLHLNLNDLHSDNQQTEKLNKLQLPGERGVDVRISEIVWVMDAPFGS